MSKFITGVNLEKAIYDIIWEAENKLLIVSPYIKLDNYFKKLFDKHSNNPNLNIIIVFGKNEMEVSRSLSKDDFEYFKKFLNISIVYVPNLHAKYYGNDKKGVITSINLYDYSFKNNIEFGIYNELNILSSFTKNPDSEAWNTCIDIAESHEAIFIKRPVFEKKILSTFLGKNYIKSDILHDTTEKFYSFDFRSFENTKKTILDFPFELEIGSNKNSRPVREELLKQTTGFCIRTGERIEFNIKKPFSYQAYKSWVVYSNENFPEKFCHKTGKPSFGKTSMKNPIL